MRDKDSGEARVLWERSYLLSLRLTHPLAGVEGAALDNIPKVGTWVLRVSRNPVHPDQLNGTK